MTYVVTLPSVHVAAMRLGIARPPVLSDANRVRGLVEEVQTDELD
jgi:hypothetical protein